MPSHRPIDEIAAEALLRVPPGPVGDDALVRFLQDVRAVVDQPAPVPTAALARVLRSGFSSNPPAPLATAASRRPKEHIVMKPSGFLRGLAVKALVVGTTLGVGISTAAAAGVLPGASQGVVADVIHSITPLQLPGTHGGATTSANLAVTVPGTGGVNAGTDAGLSVGAGAASAGAGVGGSVSTGGQSNAGASGPISGVTGGGGVTTGVRSNAGATGPVASVSGVTSGVGTNPVHVPLPVPTPNVVSTITSVKAAVTGCLGSVVNASTGQPVVAPAQVLPLLEACVKNVTGALPLPPAVASCTSGLFNSLSGLPVLGTGGLAKIGGLVNLGALANVGGLLNMTGCLPVDLSTCLPATSTGITGIATLPGSVAACASSIVAGVLNLVGTLPGPVTGAVSGSGSVTGSTAAGH